MKEGASRALKLILGLGISGLLIWLTLRGDVPCGPDQVAATGGDCRVSKIAQLVSSLGNANYLALIPYFGFLVVIHFCRTIRWGILLEPIGKPTFQRLNSASAIGFMALVTMPFRLGEFARPLLIAEKGRIRRSAAMASVVVERVIDGIAMAIVLIVALLCSKPATTDQKSLALVRASGWIVFAFFFALLVFCVVAYVKREWAVRLTERVFSPVSAKLARRLAGMLDAFIGGLKMVPDGKKIALFVALTVVYWGLNGVGMMMLARAGFGLPLELIAAFTVLGVLVAGVMIPAGPAMLGTFHWAIIVGMSLFFPEPAQYGKVVAYAWVVWGAQFSQQVLFGLYFLVRGHVAFGSLWRTSTGDDEDEEGPRAAA
ncbi:MAG: flippase-like domain-containing protein [Deltaproteobacteria bacterium]|nr:flippase-like domain-containing protein [Deltaproteobacteria bacterium]